MRRPVVVFYCTAALDVLRGERRASRMKEAQAELSVAVPDLLSSRPYKTINLPHPGRLAALVVGVL